MLGHIYVITNTANDKKYVGQTVRSVEKRWVEHLAHARIGEGTAIARAIRKYGHEKFVIKEIDCADSPERLDELEEGYIKSFGTLLPNGYNLHTGGRHHITLSETKAKISAALFGNQYAKGFKHSDETKMKVSEAGKGRKFSDEHKRKIGIASEGRQCSPEAKVKIGNANRGRQKSAETIAKISAGNKGKVMSAESRRKLSLIKMGNDIGVAGRAKISAAHRGKPLSQEHRVKLGVVQKLVWAKRKWRAIGIEYSEVTE